MGRFRMKMAQFMYGRYGTDRLYHTMVWTALGLLVLNLFVGSWIIYLTELALIFWATFRCFSRNIYKRQRENQAFCRFFARIGAFFKLRKNKFRDRKTHVYKRCPSCRNQLRLPKIKGHHTVNCPCCRTRFQIKV